MDSSSSPQIAAQFSQRGVAEGLQAGWARAEISPTADCSLLGYDQRLDYFPQPGNAGVHDPLFADVLVLQKDGTGAVLITLDLAIIETPCSDRLRNLVASVTGIPAKCVMIACSHTHSGPYPWLPEWASDQKEEVPPPILSHPSQNYVHFLEQRIGEAARKAVADLAPATLRFRASQLTCGYNRRVPDGNGKVKMAWNLREWNGPEPTPADDPAFSVLVIERPAPHPSILIWNAAAHAVVLGKTSNVVSADWPGAARKKIETGLNSTKAIFLHGAGGDVHPWLATGNNPDDLEVVSAPAASLAILLASTPGGVVSDPLLKAGQETIKTEGGEIELTAIRLGPAIILAVPCEIFGRTGALIRESVPNLLLATTANGWACYWPPVEAYPEGGHEVDAAITLGRSPRDCEKLVVGAKRLLDSLR